MLVVNGNATNLNMSNNLSSSNNSANTKYKFDPSPDGFLSNDSEYKNKIITNLIDVYYKDLLPQNHLNFLIKLKTDYNFTPSVCYDIGAAVLHWTRHIERIWPNSKVILFDAFEPVKFLYNKYDYHIGVLSDQDNKQVKFYQNDQYFGGNSYYKEIGTQNVFPNNVYLLKNTRSLDSIVTERRFPYPDLIKIDVQGAELDILKGAIDILSNTKYLIVELQHVNYNDGAPLYNETKDFLESIGWECIAEKFSDNGPDADYCFRNKKLN
jgi:FkbM family methyltransferase